jgi:regulator of CtrA degradation
MTVSGSTSPPGGGFPATTFFSKTYDEAQDLVVEAMNYAKYSGEMTEGPQAQSLLCSVESLRLTARLSQILAWLLFQRAVHAGELPPEQAVEPANRLGGQEICNERGGEHMMVVPAGLRDLLLRRRKLYQRIARLDEMIARDLDANNTVTSDLEAISPPTDPLL